MVLNYFTLNDKIANDSLNAISDISQEQYDKTGFKSPLVVGGFAVQIYNKDKLDYHRPTFDIDMIHHEKIDDFSEFKRGFGKDLRDKLLNPYQVQFKKSKQNNQNMSLKIMLGQGNKAKELFFINLDQYYHTNSLNKDSVEKKLFEITKEEIENANIIDLNSKPLFVKRIEDVLSHKLNRLCNNFEDSYLSSPLEKSLYKFAKESNWKELSNMSLDSWLDSIIMLQNDEKSMANKKSKKIYIINKDLYDICLLSQYIEGNPSEFNKAYFLKSLDRVQSLNRL